MKNNSTSWKAAEARADLPLHVVLLGVTILMVCSSNPVISILGILAGVNVGIMVLQGISRILTDR